MSPTVERVELDSWFKMVWRDTPGAVKLAYQEPNLAWHNVMFSWPADINSVVSWVIKQSATGNEVFYAPALFKDKSSGKSHNVLGSWCLWVDFDGNAPTEWSGPIEEPSARIQSSLPGNQHCYWMLDEFIERPTIEGKNRALAYELGADTSGWDAGQVLRPPSTTNHGFTKPERSKIHTVEIFDMSKAVYNQAFVEIPENFVQVVKDSLDFDSLPNLGLVLSRGKFTDDFRELFFKEESPEKGVRSDALMAVGYMAAEAGLDDSEIFVCVENADSRWKKYTQRTQENRRFILANIVERARAKHPHSTFDFVAKMSGVEAPQKVVYTHKEFMQLQRSFTWTFKGLLTKNGLGIFSGEPGVGKTQILNQFVISCSTGQQFLVWQNEIGPQKVMYLGLEMPVEGLQQFMTLAEKNLGKESLHLLDQNLSIAPISARLPLDTSQGQAFLTDLLERYRPNVVVIDSLSKSTQKSLNDETMAGELNDFLMATRSKYNVTIVLVAHSKKVQVARKASAADGLNDIYGSRFITGDLDFLLSFYKVKPKGHIYVANNKNRYAEEHYPFTLERNADLSFTVIDIHDTEGDAGTDFVDKFISRQNIARGTGTEPTEKMFGDF